MLMINMQVHHVVLDVLIGNNSQLCSCSITIFIMHFELRGPMRPRVCLSVKHTFTNGGGNARDEAQ
jgi:hypothetical protein